MAYASEKGVQVNPYADPTPAPTAAQADYQNTVGNQNRADKGLAPVGNSQQGYEEVQVAQQRQQEQERQKQEAAIQAATMMDRFRAAGFTGMPTGQSTYDRVMGYEQAPVQERTYIENLQNRPRYTDPSQLGDTNTQAAVKGVEMMRQMGFNVASSDEMYGRVLEGQRKRAESTPGTKDDQYFLNELSKWNANAIETSSEYHHETLATGVQQRANPYENRGDVALAFEKGGNLKDFQPDRYGFNQNVQEEINRLPEGMGLQETAWGVAKSGQPSNVDFSAAIEYQVAQKDRYGPYGELYGGVVDKPYESEGSPVSREPIGNARLAWGGNVQNPQQTPTGKDWNPFVASAAEPTGYIGEGMQFGNTTPKQESQSFGIGMIFSGYENLNKNVRDFLRFPTPEVGEAGMEFAAMGNLAIPGGGPVLIGQKIAIEGGKLFGFDTKGAEAAKDITQPFKGQYTQFYEQPLLTVGSYAAGAAFGTGAKAVESVYGASRAAAAEQIIARGQIYRAAEQFSGFVIEKAPLVLGGMYGVSIAERSTQGFTTFAPDQVVPKARGIIMQEAVPMGYGFNAPGQVVKTAQLSNLNYKAAVQEGATTGRFDYYVKQPFTKPIELAKIDYAAFKQEGGQGVTDYVFSKTKPIEGEINRNYIPYEGIEKVAYPKPAERVIQQEPNRNYIPYEGIEQTAYPKTPAKTIVPESQRNYYEYSGIERDAYPINSLVITAKAKWQEWRTPERLLYFSSYGGQNVISQGLPPENWGATIGTRGIPGSTIRRDDSDVGGRITPKTVGGAQVSGLKPEQSMRMGAETISKETTVPKSFGQRYDFRGQERGSMKPMDSSQIKQSAIQIEMQEAPARMPAPERVSQPQSFDYSILQVYQPEQEQRQRSVVDVMPAFMSAQVTGQQQEQKQSQKQVQVQEAARERQFNQVMKQSQKTERAATQTFRQTTTPFTVTRTDQTIDQTVRQTPDIIQRQGQRIDQKITPTFEPWQNPPQELTKRPTGFIPGGFPQVFGGSGGYGTKRRPRKFSELFPVGLFDSAMAAMRGKRLPKTKAKKGRLIPKKWGK